MEPSDLRPSRLPTHLAGPTITLLLLGLIAWTNRPRETTPPVTVVPKIEPKAVEVVQPPPAPAPKPIEIDRAAVARAEADVDSAARDRGRAESRLADAEIALRKASLESARLAAGNRSFASKVKDPTARIERATNRANLSRWEVKKLQTELASLSSEARPKARPLMDRSAVAKPIDGKEFHFEVHADRVAFIDIERFADLVKSEVRMRARLTTPGRPIVGTVGPLGDFSMRYEMGLDISESLAVVLDRREISYQLRGWEIVPEHDLRGEAYAAAWQPAAAFARVVNRLDPSSATITLWTYPDGFSLYRRLRDDLHARGFLVAARPLPDGMAIRGSPVGSLSAGQ